MRLPLWPTLLALAACRYTYSPYTAEVAEVELNRSGLETVLAQEPPAGTTYKVAFVADTHNYYDDLRDLVKAVNGRGPYAFVVVAGDVTNLGLLDEFRATHRLLAKLKFPHLVVVGNHDLLSNGARVYRRFYGPSRMDFTYGDTQFVLFDNNNWESGGNVPDFDWVSDRLRAGNASRKVLVAHVSPADQDRFSPRAIARWEGMMAAEGVGHFVHGHDHNPAETTFGGATRLTVGAPSKRVYLEMDFTPGGVSHRHVRF